MRSLAVVVALVAAALPGAAQASVRVSGGTVQGVSAGHVGGTFTVVNTGHRTVRRSTARLAARSGARRWTTIKTYRIAALRPGARRTITVRRVAVPQRLRGRTVAVRVCAGASCKTVGTTRVPPRIAHPIVPAPGPGPVPAPGPAPAPAPRPAPAPPPAPATTVPPHPIGYRADTSFAQTSAQSKYWLYVPDAYDRTHQTASELFVWMHGCGGDAQGDLDTYAKSSESYIMLSLDGARTDDGCWDVNGDSAKVLAAIADVEDRFNIDRHRIVIGGYSSGGDLAYRTAFYNASTFAGLLAENTSPFRDTGSTADQSLAAATWRFPIVHLAHNGDTTYPIAGVIDEISTLQQAGWSATLIRRDGDHYDANTDRDLEEVLLPYLDAGWTSP